MREQAWEVKEGPLRVAKVNPQAKAVEWPATEVLKERKSQFFGGWQHEASTVFLAFGLMTLVHTDTSLVQAELLATCPIIHPPWLKRRLQG